MKKVKMKTDKERMEEILEETLEFYLTDTSRLSNDGETCRYRLECDDGTVKKCAVGRYIKDGMYRESIEGRTAGSIDRLDELLVEEVRGLYLGFWIRLQDIHDNLAQAEWVDITANTWTKRIGNSLGLDITKAQEIIKRLTDN